MKHQKLHLAQTLFTLFMYVIGAIIFALAIYPPILLSVNFWSFTVHLAMPIRFLVLSITITFGYFIFGFTLIILAGLTRILFRLKIKEGVYPIGSPMMIRWMMDGALYTAVRITFMDFMLLTPFCSLFFKIMGARIGHNVQINSNRVGDVSLVEIGDNSVIGGNATVISHSFEREGLYIHKVRIGKNVIIGLNSVIMPGCHIGDGAIIAAGSILPKNTVVEEGEVYYGKGRGK